MTLPGLSDASVGLSANAWTIPASHKAAWSRMLTQKPAYIVLKADPGSFGNDPYSGLDGFADYTCQNRLMPIVAVFTGSGKLIPLGKSGCKLAHRLMGVSP